MVPLLKEFDLVDQEEGSVCPSDFIVAFRHLHQRDGNQQIPSQADFFCPTTKSRWKILLQYETTMNTFADIRQIALKARLTTWAFSQSNERVAQLMGSRDFLEGVTGEQILELVRECCSLPPAEFHVSLLTSSGEHASVLHAGDYTLVVGASVVGSDHLCLKDTEGKMMSSWLLSVPGNPHLGQDMPILDENTFVQARVELPEEAIMDSEAELY